jgi:glycosyltransferase involved in cell wall biosynthesis
MPLANRPLVSILMPTLDQARFLRESVGSVLTQSYPDLELVVADGGSADGTVDILRELAAADSRVRWLSSRDQGPADALNGALSRARGTVIGWLNSDDLYTPGAVGRAVEALRSPSRLAAVYGHADHIDAAGRVLGRYPTHPPSAPLQQFREGCFICQPTMFLRRSTAVLLGTFDTRLRTAFDFDYWLRLMTAMRGRIGFVDVVQAQSRLHDGSITIRQRKAVALEGLALVRKYLDVAPVQWVLTHIAEILDGVPVPEATEYQRAEVRAFLEAAGAYLSPHDRDALLARWAAPTVSAGKGESIP